MTWPPTTVLEVTRWLGHPRVDWDGLGHKRVEQPWAIPPADYLRFARTDLRQCGKRGNVNALGNAKRLLHCQADSILFASGLHPLAEKRRWSFPMRLK